MKSEEKLLKEFIYENKEGKLRISLKGKVPLGHVTLLLKETLQYNLMGWIEEVQQNIVQVRIYKKKKLPKSNKFRNIYSDNLYCIRKTY